MPGNVAIPFADRSGIEVIESSAERVVGRVAWSDDGCTTGGILHGGLLMTLADTVGAVCAFLNLPQGGVPGVGGSMVAAGTATIESKTNFCRPVSSGSATATSVPVHVGRTTILLETRIEDDQGRLVALTTQTQAVLAAR